MNKILVSAFLLLVSFSFASAELFGYSSPLEALGGESARVVMVGLLFFAILLLSTQKAFGKENKGVAVLVSILVSLLITFTLYQRGFFQTYAGDEFGGWLIFFGFLVIFFFIFKSAYRHLDGLPFVFFLFLFWIVFHFFVDPVLIFPSISNGVLFIYSLLFGWPGLILILITGLIVFSNRKHLRLRYY